MENRKYKDTLFRYIFGREENKAHLLSLYNALAGSDCADEGELELTTIEDVIYVTRKNDVSFLIGSEMYLLEQQSGWNPNMPLRGLLYYAQLYNKYLEGLEVDVYGTRLLRIPAPRFYVLYNGGAEVADRSELRLSEAFEGEAEGFEWTAVVLNINYGRNRELMEACGSLKDYAEYVKMVRDGIARGEPFGAAVDGAARDAAGRDLLGGFFKRHRAEVLDMILTEFDQEKYDYSRRLEGFEQGIEQGARQTRMETARNFLVAGVPMQTVADCTGLSLEEVEGLQRAPALA